MHRVGKNGHFNSLNISLDDVLNFFLSTVSAARFVTLLFYLF